MDGAQGLLARIQALLSAKRYRIRIHAVRHMIEEGFDEDKLLEALAGRSRILEDYPNEERCLILGYFAVGEKSRAALHVVCGWWTLSPPIFLKGLGGSRPARGAD
jgi:hypothetical protein